MIERKQLYHPAERKPLYDQTQPFFSKIRFQFRPPQYCPSTAPKTPPPGCIRRPTCRIKGKSQLVYFVLDSFANSIICYFPFIRQVASYTLFQAKGQKAGPHLGASLLSFVLSYMTKRSPPERRERSFASVLVTKLIVSLPYRHFPSF